MDTLAWGSLTPKKDRSKDTHSFAAEMAEKDRERERTRIPDGILSILERWREYHRMTFGQVSKELIEFAKNGRLPER